jgi:hypothetical protein
MPARQNLNSIIIVNKFSKVFRLRYLDKASRDTDKKKTNYEYKKRYNNFYFYFLIFCILSDTSFSTVSLALSNRGES